jgi:hypothetical protein
MHFRGSDPAHHEERRNVEPVYSAMTDSRTANPGGSRCLMGCFKTLDGASPCSVQRHGRPGGRGRTGQEEPTRRDADCLVQGRESKLART